MSKNKKTDESSRYDKDSKSELWSRFFYPKYLISLIFLIFIFHITIVFWLIWPIDEYSITNIGTFGDSFGILTSLFSALAFAGLIVTIRMQSDQLELQRQDLNIQIKEQREQKAEIARSANAIESQNLNLEQQIEATNIRNYDATFFELKSFLDSQLLNIEYYTQKLTPIDRNFVQTWPTPPSEKNNGVRALMIFLNWFHNEHNLKKEDNQKSSTDKFLTCVNTEIPSVAGYLGCLSAICEHLCSFLEIIGESKGKFYIRLVKNSISSAEAEFLFLYCLVEDGTRPHQRRLRTYIEKFGLLENMDNSSERIPVDWTRMYQLTALGEPISV